MYEYNYSTKFKNIFDLYLYRIPLRRIIVMILILVIAVTAEYCIIESIFYSALLFIGISIILVQRLITTIYEFSKKIIITKNRLSIVDKNGNQRNVDGLEVSSWIYVNSTRELIIVFGGFYKKDINLYDISYSDLKSIKEIFQRPVDFIVRESPTGKIVRNPK